MAEYIQLISTATVKDFYVLSATVWELNMLSSAVNINGSFKKSWTLTESCPMAFGSIAGVLYQHHTYFDRVVMNKDQKKSST